MWSALLSVGEQARMHGGGAIPASRIPSWEDVRKCLFSVPEAGRVCVCEVLHVRLLMPCRDRAAATRGAAGLRECCLLGAWCLVCCTFWMPGGMVDKSNKHFVYYLPLFACVLIFGLTIAWFAAAFASSPFTTLQDPPVFKL